MLTSNTTKKRRWIAYAHEVRAILDGRQSQFRRPMKPQPECGASCPRCIVCGMDKPPHGRSVPMESAAGYCCSHDCKGYWEEPLTGSLWPGESQGDFGYPVDWMGDCPFGKPGDRLWVREKFSTYLFREECWYWADGNEAKYDATIPKPSIHMPRWASRINLEVTDVRTQRVQDVSEDDIKAEGVRPIMVDSGGETPWGAGIDVPDYWDPFIESWDSINTKRGFGWHLNPWTWVVLFEQKTSYA